MQVPALHIGTGAALALPAITSPEAVSPLASRNAPNPVLSGFNAPRNAAAIAAAPLDHAQTNAPALIMSPVPEDGNSPFWGHCAGLVNAVGLDRMVEREATAATAPQLPRVRCLTRGRGTRRPRVRSRGLPGDDDDGQPTVPEVTQTLKRNLDGPFCRGG